MIHSRKHMKQTMLPLNTTFENTNWKLMQKKDGKREKRNKKKKLESFFSSKVYNFVLMNTRYFNIYKCFTRYVTVILRIST